MLKILRTKEVCDITGYSLSTLYRLEKAGRFPKKRKLSERSVGYLASEVQAWIESLETATTENTKPVPEPGPGKKRGRRPKNPNHVNTPEPTTAPPEVERFLKAMRKTGLKPLEKIIPDGEAHVIEFEEDSRILKGTYLLDLQYPLVGLYRCANKNKKWAGKNLDALSEQEMSDFTKKHAALKQKLKAAMNA